MNFFAVFVSFLCLLPSVTSVVNTDVSQVFDVTTSIVHYSAEIKASEIQGQYRFLIQNNWANHLAYFSITNKGKSLKVQDPVR
jgi:hypothetical protein